MNNHHDPEILLEIRSWLQTALITGPIETRGHSDNSGHPHTYAAVLIPDWQIKQKVAAIDAMLQSMGPYLVNHADAVDGSYCIARRMPDPPLYEQYWSGDKWTGAGQVFKLHPPRLMQLADKLRDFTFTP